ncbi:MAG: DUF2752 domain-containing protein [Myxococcaceae bacterium]|nr:DUF2752 domain-containing protein [Myxococcaceae bacterium]
MLQSRKQSWVVRNLSWQTLATPFLTPASRWLALLVLVFTLVVQPPLSGPDLCPLHRATGWPCPGCGVTRGLVSFAHARFDEALHWNPFVFVLWPVLFVLGSSVVLPRRAVEKGLQWVEAQEPWPSRLLRVLVVAFFGFGLVRLLSTALNGSTFP